MAATDPTMEPDPVGDDHDGDEGAHVQDRCPVTWCPICVTVGAVQPMAPEVMEHLLKAGTELFMAFRAVIDARADGSAGAMPEEPPSATSLEKIDLG